MSKEAPACILVVEDDAVNAHVLAQGLADRYRLLIANCGEKALEIALAKRPDLILLDIELPDMDGYQVCRSLKSDKRTQHIPLIFITSHDSDEDELKGLEMGAADYFTKPFKLPLINVRVTNQIELKRKTDLLEKLADLDGLTGIPNRRRFDECFEEEWRRAMREESTLSLCYMDVDFFKQFNDHYGHAAGDECLRKVAHTLKASAQRAGDFVARYGGEEFVALLPNQPLQDALKFAGKIQNGIKAVAVPHAYSSCAEHVTLSIGVVSAVPSKHLNKADLAQSADEQLYLAKSQGRNCISGRQVSAD